MFVFEPNKKSHHQIDWLMAFLRAEREGFEPSVPFWGTHAFQASPFDRSGTSPDFEQTLNIR